MLTARKRISQILISLCALVLVVSLVMNYENYRKAKHAQQYVELLYNQFIFDVSMAGDYLGAENGHVDYQRAAVDTADAANVLYALSKYESIAEGQKSPTLSTPHVNDIANFLSYVSLAFVKENEQFQTANGLVTITPQSAKNIMLKLNSILTTNMKDSNIPADKVEPVFNQINQLIPQNIRTDTSVLYFFNN